MIGSEVIGTLLTLLFSVPTLDWDKEITHVETFAGCASVTRGEIEAMWERGQNKK